MNIIISTCGILSTIKPHFKYSQYFILHYGLIQVEIQSGFIWIESMQRVSVDMYYWK